MTALIGPPERTQSVHREGTKEAKRHSVVLERLARRCDGAFKEHFPGREAFVKLDSRSPKDAVVSRTSDLKLRETVRKQILMAQQQRSESKGKAEGSSQDSQVSPEAVLHGLMTALMLHSKVTSGEQVIQLLCSSSRIREDLVNVKKFVKYGMYLDLVLRAWDPDIARHPEREFRGFVCNNRLTAVSQYDHKTRYAELQGDAIHDSLCRRFLSFFDAVLKESLSHIASYVVDFYVTSEKIWLVELNSFGLFFMNFTAR